MYDKVKFHEVLYALGIRGWGIKTAPTTEEYFLANFKRRTGMGTNDMGEPCEIMSTNPSEFGFTWSEFMAKHAELEIEYDAQAYARKRRVEYPNIYDYIDGIVKNDQTQIDKYISDSQAVKDKHPKGE